MLWNHCFDGFTSAKHYGGKIHYNIPTVCIEEQLKAIFEDISIDAVKIGMLFREDIVEVVARSLSGVKNIVLDPVMIAKNGHRLLLPDAIDVMKQQLFPIAPSSLRIC